MDEWKTIDTAEVSDENVILWNGKRVFVGYRLDAGWCDACVNDQYAGEPEQPQPTHWMPMPEPPSIEAPEPRI
jgi:hypothetical protein